MSADVPLLKKLNTKELTFFLKIEYNLILMNQKAMYLYLLFYCIFISDDYALFREQDSPFGLDKST